MSNDMNPKNKTETMNAKPATKEVTTGGNMTFDNLKKTVQYQIIKAFNKVHKVNVGQMAKANHCPSSETVSASQMQQILNATESTRIEVDGFTLMENGIHRMKLQVDGRPQDLTAMSPLMNTLIESDKPLKKAVRTLKATAQLIEERNTAMKRRGAETMPLIELIENEYVDSDTVPSNIDSLTEMPNFLIDTDGLHIGVKAIQTGEVVGESWHTVQGFKMVKPDVDESGFITLNRSTVKEFIASTHVTSWYCSACQKSSGDTQTRHGSSRRMCIKCGSNEIRPSQATAHLPIIDNHTGDLMTQDRIGQGKLAVKRGNASIDFHAFRLKAAHMKAIRQFKAQVIDADEFMTVFHSVPVSIRVHGGRGWTNADLIPCTFEAMCEGSFKVVVGSVIKRRFNDETL
jgi:hypothetical protein